MHLDGQVIVIGGQSGGVGVAAATPNVDKTCLLGSRIDVEAEILNISTPPIRYDIIKPL